jgi:hypothetical protein
MSETEEGEPARRIPATNSSPRGERNGHQVRRPEAEIKPGTTVCASGATWPGSTRRPPRSSSPPAPGSSGRSWTPTRTSSARPASSGSPIQRGRPVVRCQDRRAEPPPRPEERGKIACFPCYAADNIKRMFEPKQSVPRCSFQGCGKPRSAKGLCSGHYRQHRKGWELRPLRPHYGTKGSCRFENCSKPRKRGGYCAGHAAQYYERRPLAPLFEPKSVCDFPGCTKRHFGSSAPPVRGSPSQERSPL